MKSRLTRTFIYLVFISIMVGSSSFAPALQPAKASPGLDLTTFIFDVGQSTSVEQLLRDSAFAAMQVPACKRRCQDPHPGQFRTWNGQQNGCWIQVWRGWPDGCQHYQWFNSCNGYWDINPNGSPRVFWTCCVH